jgi:hypothetical protein
MEYRGILVILSVFLVSSCAPLQPQPDPVREEVAILQKQLLELQNLQNETKARLDAAASTIGALSLKLQDLEQRQSAREARVIPAAVESKPAAVTSGSKAAAKKAPKKKTRKKVK